MKSIAIFALVIIIAAIEGLLPGQTSVFFVDLPLTIAVLVIATGLMRPGMWPWLGLAAGLALDCVSLNPLGSASMYFFLSFQAAYLISKSQSKAAGHWWLKILFFMLLTFIYPWYLLLVNGQFSLSSWQITVVSLKNAAIIGIISALPAWRNLYASRKYSK